MAGQLLFAVGIILGFAARAGRSQIRLNTQTTSDSTSPLLLFTKDKTHESCKR